MTEELSRGRLFNDTLAEFCLDTFHEQVIRSLVGNEAKFIEPTPTEIEGLCERRLVEVDRTVKPALRQFARSLDFAPDELNSLTALHVFKHDATVEDRGVVPSVDTSPAELENASTRCVFDRNRPGEHRSRKPHIVAEG